MGLLEDLNSGKYNLILFSILFVLIFHQYWSKSTNESMADVSPDIKDAIKQIYNADVEAIRNLSNVATQLQAGGLTIPGDLAIKGKLTVNSDALFTGKTTTNELVTNGPFNLIPAGTIVAFNAVTAPPGWALCDGANGTPDLRGRFIRMQSDSLGGFNEWGGKMVGGNQVSYEKTISGNSRDDVNSWILNHKFGDKAGTDHQQLHINEIPTHSHRVCFPQGDQNWNSGGGNSLWGGTNSACRQTENTGASWGHNNQPPYYVLSYIMKL